MTRKIVRHSAARQDILEEAYTIADDNLSFFDRSLQEMGNAFRRPAEMPGLGTLRDYNRLELQWMRIWPIPNFRRYLIFYRADE